MTMQFWPGWGVFRGLTKIKEEGINFRVEGLKSITTFLLKDLSQERFCIFYLSRLVPTL